MYCPECGGEIVSTGKFNLGINGSGEYICENCNIKISVFEEELKEECYIDADKMREEWLENGENEYVYDTNSVLNSIDSQPTADVVEVKRGHWIEDEVCVYACSECGFTFTSAEDISEFKYCRCGADMRGEEK